MKKKIIILGIVMLLVMLGLGTYILAVQNTNGIEEDRIITVDSKEIKMNKLQMQIDEEKNKVILDNNSIIKEIGNNKILDKEVEKRNITLSKNEQAEVKALVEKASISKESEEKIVELGFNEDEFRDYMQEEVLKMQLRVKLKLELINEINSNSIQVENLKFKEEVEEYNKNNNENESITECLKLVDEYIKILQESYVIIEAN